MVQYFQKKVCFVPDMHKECEQMKEIGKIYKMFRESRGLSIRDVANKDLSRSQLSRFEKGETSLTVSKFMVALEQINMPIDEFMFAVKGFKQSEFDKLLTEVKKCFLERDIKRLQNILIQKQEQKTTISRFQHLEIIFLKIKLQELSHRQYYSDADTNVIVDYLFSVEYWGNFELLLFGNLMYIFKQETFKVLAKEMFHRTDFYRDIPNYRRIISSMALNAYIICIDRNELTDAKYFEEQLKTIYFDESEIYERLIFQYATAYFEFKQEGSVRAILGMKKAIGFMRVVECEKLAIRYEKHLKEILEEK